MDILVIHLFNALLYASVLFLIAGGLSLIYGVMRIVNLAHGNLFALGAFITASAVGQWFAGSESAWVYLLLPAGAIGAGLVGAVLEPSAPNEMIPFNSALKVRTRERSVSTSRWACACATHSATRSRSSWPIPTVVSTRSGSSHGPMRRP